MPEALQYRVNALNLNLRTTPEVKPETRLAVLSRGQIVSEIDAINGWLKVSTQLGGQTLTGFVARQFLVPLQEFEEPAEHHGLTEVHLSENNPSVRRAVSSGRAFPIGEPDRPRRRAAGSTSDKVTDLSSIIDWLDVEHSARYQVTGSNTYCNIYAYDYCYLAAAYLPRVWWKPQAIVELRQGRPVKAEYDKTVVELNANGLFEWLAEFGDDFQWKRTFDLNELQESANAGAVGVICAQRAELNRSGHISVVVPETQAHRAVRDGSTVIRPLQSQAGRANFKYSALHWWTQAKFRQFGFWGHP